MVLFYLLLWSFVEIVVGNLLGDAVNKLENSPPDIKTQKLVNYFVKKASQTECNHKPLFLTIAHIKTRLYWQLVENFFYTMDKFGHRKCASLICISGISDLFVITQYFYIVSNYRPKLRGVMQGL